MRFLLALLIPAGFVFSAEPSVDPVSLLNQAKTAVLDPNGRLTAESLLRQALDVWDKQPAKPDEYAAANLLLGMTLYPAVAANKEALETQVEPFARKAMELRQKNPDTPPADLATALEFESLVLEQMGRLEDSRVPKAKARALRDQLIIAMQAPSSDAEPEHMGNPGILPPRLIARTDPEMTFEARVLKLQPEVIAELVIGSDGIIHQIEMYHPAGFGLDESAVKALQKWKFLPAQKAGIPVAVEGTLRLKFR